ncbi:MAG TPA: tetratricopeptide repeat protein [Gemmataceae bacterium]|nr:tetratricopeptide repeat protein [Gemmataceae bacterium]
MSPRNNIPALARIALTGRRRALDWLYRLAVLAILAPLTTGCETEKHERFRQYNDEGIHLYQQGDYASARDHFELALPLEPKDASVLYNLGQCNDRLNQTARAEDYYKQCLQANANHPECRHALALLMYRTGRNAEADQMIQEWLNNEPALGAAYAEDGWRLRQAGQFQPAVGRFQQALHYDPKNVRAMTELGQIYEEHEHPELALSMYTLALQQNAQQPALKERINLLMAKGVRKPLPD